MITEAVQAVMNKYDYRGGMKVTVSIPGGAELAKKTFNPKLGIEGGLSVLGTTGIVDPMSEQALVDTIHVEMDSRRAAGDRHVLAFSATTASTSAGKNGALLRKIELRAATM